MKKFRLFQLRPVIIIFSLIVSPFVLIAQNMNLDWAVHHGVSNGTSIVGHPESTVIDNQGNVYVTGIFGGTVDFNPNPAQTYNLTAQGSDGFVSKTDPDGNFVWAIKFGGDGTDNGTGISLDDAGSLFVTGLFQGNAAFGSGQYLNASGPGEAFVLKLNPNGTTVWAKQVGDVSGADLVGRAITVDENNNVLVAGLFWGPADFNPAPGQYYNLISSSFGPDIFILKLANNGSFIWARKFDNIGGEGESFTVKSITTDDADNVYTCGSYRGAFDFDPHGQVFSLTPTGGSDVFVSKLDEFGSFIWAKSMGGPGDDQANSLVRDLSGNCYTTGYFSGTADFDPSAGSANVSSAGGNDAFVSVLDNTGSYVWAGHLGGSLGDAGNSIAVDGNFRMYISGFFQGTADFNPDINITYNLTASGTEDAFVCKLDLGGDFLWAKQIGGTTGSIFPGTILLNAVHNIYLSGYSQGTIDFDPDSGSDFLLSNSPTSAFVAKYCESNIPKPVIALQTTVSPCFDGYAHLTSSYASGNLWSTNETTREILVNDAGNYTLSIDGGFGCLLSTDVLVAESDVEPIQYDYDHSVFAPLTINEFSPALADQNGDGKIYIRGPVVIQKSGGTGTNFNFTINNLQLYFVKDGFPESEQDALPHSGIVVRQKANLIVTNSLLTSGNLCNMMWDGIKVVGSENIHSSSPGLSISNSTIEQAHTGVHLGEYSLNQAGHGPGGNPNLPSQYPFLYLTNGKIEATNTTFRNNRVAVNFADSYGKDVPSFITQCTFVCDALLVDQNAYPGEGSEVFIQLHTTRSLPISANTFTGFTGLPENQRGTAIRSYDSHYTVTSALVGTVLTPNTFNRLTKGIDVYSAGSLANTVRIRDNVFNKVMQGITSNGSNFDEIRENDFYVPAGTPLHNTWGLNLYHSSGFLATENHFYTNATSSYTYGVLTRNNSIADGQLYKNYFHGDFEAATQAEQNNSLLTIKCNQYTGNNAYDWKITSGFLANQGECSGTDDTKPAGNVFSPCTGNNESQIYKALLVPNFIYNTHTNLTPNQNCISPNIDVIPCIGTTYNANTSCPVTTPLPSIGKKPGGGILNPAEAARIRAAKIRTFQDAGNISGLVAFVTNNSLPQDIYLLIPTLLDRHDCATARLKLQSMISTDYEATHFYRLFHVLTVLCEGNRTIHELTPVELQEIQDVSESQSRVSVHAQSILASLENNAYLRSAERSNGTHAMMTDNIITENQTDNKLSVFPNPSDGEVNITLKQLSDGELTIVDALGRIEIIQKVSKENINNIIVKLNKGIHIIHFTDEQGFVESKRIVIKE